MLTGIWNSVAGYVIIEIKGKGLERFLNLAVHSGIEIWRVRRTGVATVTARVSVEGFYALRTLVRGQNVHVRILEKRGFIMRLSRLRFRKVLLYGWAIVLALLVAASRRIWFIEVEGCDTVREAEVLAALDTMEVRIGSRRNAVPTSQLGGELMASDPRIAWAGARLDGVTLRVSLQEAEAIPQLPSGGQKTPVSIYASATGVILSMDVYAGEARVVPGAAVDFGDANLDLRIGDTVLVQKAGEIIPEILSVVREKRPEGTVPFHMPDTCPECGAPVVRDPDGAALRCTGAECPAQRLRNIAHFASREAMDIDGLGISLCQSLIEAGLVHSPAELYALEPQSVAALDHMGKKSAENLMAAIEKSKDAGMARLLCAFGIRQVGQKAARVLAMHFGTLDKLMAATEEELMAIPDVGPTTAAYLRAWFDNPQSQHQIRLLRDAGVSFDSREQVVDRRFAGKTFVLTGALEHFSRDEASAIIERFGGKTSSSVSKKTSYLLAGENTGSKYQKALTLGTPIITEAEFLDMIQE